nr:ATP-dependent RNA helicase DDX54 [Onthophagus taurus]
MEELPGFEDFKHSENVDSDDDNESTLKPTKTNKKSGGFQSMGISYNVLKGIIKRGYKIPTPIQRKTIPLALEGRDVVAMARTGSGKTASFLIPLFEKLKVRSAKSGARGLILSPTRELALQTLKFVKELGKFTDLKAAVILGGDSMEDQFAVIHGSPDIIVATPGRFLHVCIEMDLKLSNVECIIFDEADRLFEMGFGEQLNEIVNRLPDNRQTLLFSATLPRVLVDFAKAGLSDPVLIRLDVESKLPEQLQLHFITVRAEEKVAGLLVLLKNHIEAKQQTVVFAATKHHVEYLHLILDKVGISNTYIYSNLDPAARKIHAAKFSSGKSMVLIVTDVAARGIDIPQLDNVINFNFPAKAKLFVHRVGRCARAGRSGTAYSLISPDEYAHLLDLYLFLGKKVSFVTTHTPKGDIGHIPQSLLEEQQCFLLGLHETYIDLVSMREVSEKGYKQYLRSRPAASVDSNKRIKELPFGNCGIHTIFQTEDALSEIKKENILERMKNYRPSGTIFELCSKNKSEDYQVMKTKRALHKNQIALFHQKLSTNSAIETTFTSTLPSLNNKEIEETFKEVILPKKRKIDDLYKTKKPKKIKDDENFIPYQPRDKHTEDGLAVNSFAQEANQVQMDLTGDSHETMRMSKQVKKWDRKKKKMITVDTGSKHGKIKTESGVWIPATYKSNRYAQWKEKTKADEDLDDDSGDDDEKNKKGKGLVTKVNTHWARHNEKLKMKMKKSELKSTDQILKARMLAEKKKKKQKGKKKTKRKHK